MGIIKEKEMVQKEVYNYIYPEKPKHSTLYTPKNPEFPKKIHEPMFIPEYSGIQE